MSVKRDEKTCLRRAGAEPLHPRIANASGLVPRPTHLLTGYARKEVGRFMCRLSGFEMAGNASFLKKPHILNFYESLIIPTAYISGEARAEGACAFS